MTDPLIVYHSADLDGKCAAAIALTGLSGAELYPIDYGQPFDFERAANRRVIMVDFSLEPFEEMIRLNQLLTKDLFTWIDHHKTAVEQFQLVDPEGWDARLKIGLAGCELTWDYIRTGEDMPEAVELLGRYDVWDNQDKERWEQVILPFQYAMRNRDNDPEAPIWKELLVPGHRGRPDLSPYILVGRDLLNYERRQNAIYAKNRCFATKIMGYDALAVNRGMVNSNFFDAVWDADQFDLMLGFCLMPSGKWKVQLYTTNADVDVSFIAKNYGGGGHRQAAGFEYAHLPFEMKGPIPGWKKQS